MRRLSFAALLCSAALFAVSGCGVRHTPVKGMVTMDGQPYGDVIITFVPVDGGRDVLPSALADESGKFEMGTERVKNGVKPGKYKVTIAPGAPPDSKATGHPSEAFKKQPEEGKGGKVDANKEYKKIEAEAIKAARKKHPTVYADPDKTPLEVEVGNEPKEITLDMKSASK